MREPRRNKDVKIDYEPRPWQRVAHTEKKRFNVLVLHRRAGKTKFAMMELLDKALDFKLSLGLFAYIAPTLKQAKTTAWAELKRTAMPLVEAGAAEIRESEHAIRFKANGAQVRLFGGSDPDDMRGFRLDGVVLDEVAQMPTMLWEEVVRPALSDRLGWAIFIGTVKGVDLFSNLYFAAQEKIAAGDLDWYTGLWEVYATNALDPKEIAANKESLSPRVFAREFLCDFQSQADDQLISLYTAHEASKRVFNPRDNTILASPVILGVDPARYGDDSSVICRRQGRCVYPLLVYKDVNNMDLALHVAAEINAHKPAAVFIDAGGGAGVIDRLRQLGYTVIEVPFGGKALTAGFINRRTEMWWKMKKWLEDGGAIPNDMQLVKELATPTYWHNGQDLKCLESKEDLKKRLEGGSPDRADSMALTWASDVPVTVSLLDDRFRPQANRKKYHPFAKNNGRR